MTDTPERASDKGREEVLNRAPLLRAFLDSSASSDPILWERLLQPEYKKVDAEMAAALGKNYQIIGSGPISLILRESDIFIPTVTLETRHSYINLLTGIGFQIGDIHDAKGFFTDITMQSAEAGLLNWALFNERDLHRITHAVAVLIHIGVLWKKYSDGEVPSQFSDFINQLDF